MLKNCLKLLAVALCLLMAESVAAQMHKGDKSFGPKLGFVSENTSAYVGLEFQYAFSDYFRIAPEIGAAVRHHTKDALVAGLNFQFPLSLANDRVALYPLAGVAFNSWATHLGKGDYGTISDDSTFRKSRFGVNVGAGFEYYIKPSLRLGIEARYTLIKEYSSLYATASIAYVF